MLNKNIEIVRSHVSRETFCLLERYVDILLLWNTKINLLSRQTAVEDIWGNHILDSLVLSQVIHSSTSTLVDVGSGAGFPGLILALDNHLDCYLVEKNKKKASFLYLASAELDTKVQIFNKCISQIVVSSPKYITSRAAMSISNLIKITQHLLHPDLEYVLHVGHKHKAQEIEILEQNWSFQMKEFQNPYKANCSILSITNIKKTNETAHHSNI